MISLSDKELCMPGQEKDAIERRDEVVDLLEKYAHGTRSEERDWLIDQIARTLLGNEYESWVAEYEKNGKEIPVRKWLTGVAPSEAKDLDYDDFPIQRGDVWVNRKTGKEVVILHTPSYRHEKVQIQHASGQITEKGQHYFLYDYEPKSGQKD